MIFGILLLGLSLTGWFYDIIQEATHQGHHTDAVQQNISLGMALFILSEAMFFFSFFWAFFHYSLSPSIWIGGV
jgi:cytochrome c oxidase subunit 3